MEEWRAIRSVEGASATYEVSSCGRVRRAITAPRCRASRPGRLLNPDRHNSGYLRVSLRVDGTVHRVFVHRLVACEFLPEARKGAQVNHRDGNKTNNRIDNLEWCTAQQNVRHAWDTGLCTALTGEDASRAKLTDRDAVVIRAARQRGVKIKTLAEVFGVTEACISAVDRMVTFQEVLPNA